MAQPPAHRGELTPSNTSTWDLLSLQAVFPKWLGRNAFILSQRLDTISCLQATSRHLPGCACSRLELRACRPGTRHCLENQPVLGLEATNLVPCGQRNEQVLSSASSMGTTAALAGGDTCCCCCCCFPPEPVGSSTRRAAPFAATGSDTS